MSRARYSIWRVIGVLWTGIIFSIAIPTGVILYWIRPDFLGLPDVDTTTKLIFSAIAGVLFLISLFMIFLGVRQNRKNQAKSQEKKEGEEWV